MKNLTIALDDETHRAARIRAAELGTSVSAMVKAYLVGITANHAPVTAMREMRAPFEHAPAVRGPDGQPYFVDGRWVWTRDGKPRQPGALKGKLWVADDFDQTPDWLIDAFEGRGTDEPWPDPR